MKLTMKELYAKILDSEREIMFYDDEWVYVIFENSNKGWNVDVFTVDEGMYYTSDDYQLKFVDGGLCTGDAYDAIEFMMSTQLIDMDRASPQTRKANT